MKEIKCQNCNSMDMDFVGGMWVCRNCGSKFIPDRGEIPNVEDEKKLVKKKWKAYEKKEKMMYPEDIEDPRFDEKVERFEEKEAEYEETIVSCMEKIEEINKCNAELWVMKMIRSIWIDGSISTEGAAELCECAKKALQYAKPDEREDIESDVSSFIKHYKERILKVTPGTAPAIMEIESMLSQK